jgi:lipopolysaccharide transport system ATP-binding protein
VKASIRVHELNKHYFMTEAKGGGSITLIQALRQGKREIVSRKIEALSGISFEVREGERVGIIGRNGAGKTTLLSILAGVAEQTSGKVEIDGDVHAMLTIGAVLRNEATGRENIFLDGAVHGKGRKEIERRAEDIIAFADIGEFIDRPVRTYSSGMKGRLAFAMGAFVDPDILIIDETLAVGDAFFAEKAMRRMKEIARKGRIVFMVSHALAAIVEMCDRCLWLDQGRLIMDGAPKQVTAAYQAAVSQADETELQRKFEAGESFDLRPSVGVLRALDIFQDGVSCAATARAFEPLTIRVGGDLSRCEGQPDLHIEIIRVDGRAIWNGRVSAAPVPELSAGRAFTVSIVFDPFILGADLYCVEAALVDAVGVIDRRRRAVEVVDEEGQFGGKPLLFHAPLITARPILEITR